ncbi:ATP-binding protein [Clostridium cochlearium]|uniref:ATP-binding protein n=1 Tax=Clostridium cochlearium TaxID=1494 RepID=UPI000B94C604|nr:sensor histidine kinase [Clostridium cochlearium]MBV1818968.1 sensor histidine kinase [Bacteroidales bacterium MSK.15.36]NSJ90256.1 sensor histidine kinase [Coprococcus sp. MSK.21.13]MCG4572495.1 sensor histidine kinase [Clostridium cochlearium]MCG4578791.1 sensor histidine kinase [Clostridium cochlearium]MCR1971381.1 sensor histidine kinase [Clostridium cochlearium]
MKKDITLKKKIIIFNIVITLVCLIVTVIYMVQLRLSWLRQDMEENLMSVSKIISKSPLVKGSLQQHKTTKQLQEYIKDIVIISRNIDNIVIMDLNGTTYAKSNMEGKLNFIDNANMGELAIKKNKDDIKDNIQSFGKVIISFVVVKDEKEDPIGFVISTLKIKHIEKSKYEVAMVLFLVILSGLLIGTVGALIISRSIKDSLLGYDAEQISKLFLQKQEVIDTLEDGIIAVDKDMNINFLNKSAKNILNKDDKEIIGYNISDIIPNINKEIGYNKELHIEDTIALVNKIPIMEGENFVGLVIILKDKTEVTKLAEEITGVRQVVEALRANNHEFSNKLHVILGLIQINELDKAKKYILNQTKVYQKKISIVMNRIHEPTIAALMLGKISRAKEMGVNLIIDENSNLGKDNKNISAHFLVTVIGNLLENAIEAVSICDSDEKIVKIFIKDEKHKIIIEIEDTGGGIEEKYRQYIFNRGFSTKGEGRGRGLHIVKESVENLNGNIELSTNIGLGSKFIVLVPKEDLHG